MCHEREYNNNIIKIICVKKSQIFLLSFKVSLEESAYNGLKKGLTRIKLHIIRIARSFIFLFLLKFSSIFFLILCSHFGDGDFISERYGKQW